VITFAVIGHNEARYLRTSLGQAVEAAGDDDRVLFVDSCSDDDSAGIAAELGVEVLPAPAGKGRAVAAALEHCRSAAICLVDGDIEASERNIPAALAEHWRRGGLDMVVGEFDWVGKGPMLTVDAVYAPLVRAFFPEAVGTIGVRGLSGFRILDAGLPLGRLPGGYGLESHIGASCALDGRRVETIQVGRYWGPVRNRPELGVEVAAALLDLAEARGRLSPECRPEWDRWVESILGLIRRREATDGTLRDADRRSLEAILAGPRPAVA
jgi:glucosyl-3-phosphoglycerate synthase